jgi:hypothetical protein
MYTFVKVSFLATIGFVEEGETPTNSAFCAKEHNLQHRQHCFDCNRRVCSSAARPGGADGNCDGSAADYTFWRQHFGQAP